MEDFDYSKLLGLIKAKGETQRSIADAIGVNEAHFSRKLAGKYAFKQTEISKLCDTLGIHADEIGDYFFAKS